MRRRISATVLVALIVVPTHLAAAGTGHRHREGPAPARSGVIVGDWTWSNPGGCEETPDCAVWLESGCHPAFTGRNPGAMASIEDVGDLAGRFTSWRFEFEVAYTEVSGGAVMQLWREDCSEIRTRKWSSENCACRSNLLHIPGRARWITVTARPYLIWPGQFVTDPFEPPVIDWTLTKV